MSSYQERRVPWKFISVLATAFAVALIPVASSAADMAEAKIVNVGGADHRHGHLRADTDRRAHERPTFGICRPVLTGSTCMPPDNALRTSRLLRATSIPGRSCTVFATRTVPTTGDLPNLYAAADGTARAEFFTTRVSVSGGEMPALLDEDGSAVIIHDMPDDHMTQADRRCGEGESAAGNIAKM